MSSRELKDVKGDERALDLSISLRNMRQYTVRRDMEQPLTLRTRIRRGDSSLLYPRSPVL